MGNLNYRQRNIASKNPVAQTQNKIIIGSHSTPLVNKSMDSLLLSDGVSIVWLDANANSNSDDTLATKSMLKRLNPSVFIFDNETNCLEFLRPINNETARIFLVISGKCCVFILPELHRLPAVDSVFIFCSHTDKYEYLVNKYSPHVTGVFSQLNVLQLYLEIELNNYNQRAPIFNFFAQKQNTIRDLTFDAASFLWFQLLRKVLLMSNFDKTDMNHMITYCRTHYVRHPKRRKFLPDIDEFERTYEPIHAIRWYTRESFVYRLVNAALRTQDIEALYIFRFYISDLCRQLVLEHENLRIRHRESPILTLYRGCHMTKAELNKLRNTIGGMTSINGFISTSLKPLIAVMFSLRDSRRSTDVETVIWTIRADCRNDDVICASVAQFSEHIVEEEVLFDIGSAFRIDNVTFDEKHQVWNVEATATNHGSTVLTEYIELFHQELQETNEKIIFGTLLMDMGKYVTAQCYFKELIERYKNANHSDLSAYHYNVGLTYSYQHDNNLAEIYFCRALELQRSMPRKHRDIVRTLNALGWIYQDSGEFDKAMDYYKEAEAICEKNIGLSDIANAQTYTYMGRYHTEREQFNESNVYYERALEILRCHLPEQHQRIGIILNEMGDAKRKQGDPQQALILCRQAETIFQNVLPQKHPCMAYCWSVMGFAFLQLNQIDDAQKCHRKALNAYQHALPPDHVNIAISEKNSKCTNYDLIIDSYSQVCSRV